MVTCSSFDAQVVRMHASKVLDYTSVNVRPVKSRQYIKLEGQLLDNAKIFLLKASSVAQQVYLFLKESSIKFSKQYIKMIEGLENILSTSAYKSTVHKPRRHGRTNTF